MNLEGRRVGLCLSSGYFGFFAHCGCIEALDRLGVAPVMITGCSAGALTGALWASGLSVAEVRRVLLDVGPRDLLDPPRLRELAMLPFGAVSGRRMERTLERVLPVKKFEDCPTPLAVTTFDLALGRARHLSSGPLARGVRASASLPGMFLPADVDGHPCWDGGVAVKAPIAPLLARDDLDTIVVCHLHRDVHARPPRTLAASLRLALDSLVYASDRRAVAEARACGLVVVVVAPRVPPCGPHRLHRGAEIAAAAAHETERILAEGDFGSAELA
jgi:NTE family protein